MSGDEVENVPDEPSRSRKRAKSIPEVLSLQTDKAKRLNGFLKTQFIRTVVEVN